MTTNDSLIQGHRRFLQAATVVGGLAPAKAFDYGTPIFCKSMTAAEVRRTLGTGS